MLIPNDEPLDPRTNFVDPTTNVAYVDLDLGEGEMAHRVRFERKELEAILSALPGLAHPDLGERTHRAVDYVGMTRLVNHPDTVAALAEAKAASPTILANELERDKAAFAWLLRERPHVRQMAPAEGEEPRETVLRFADGEATCASCPCESCAADLRERQRAEAADKAAEHTRKTFGKW